MNKTFNSIEELNEWTKELDWEEIHSKADDFGFIIFKDKKSGIYWRISDWNGAYVTQNGKIFAFQVYPEETEAIVWREV